MVPGKSVLRNNGTGAHSGMHEGIPGGAVDNSISLGNVNIQQHWIIR